MKRPTNGSPVTRETKCANINMTPIIAMNCNGSHGISETRPGS